MYFLFGLCKKCGIMFLEDWSCFPSDLKAPLPFLGVFFIVKQFHSKRKCGIIFTTERIKNEITLAFFAAGANYRICGN